MVNSMQTATRLMIVARPNQSASWGANVGLLLALGIPALGIALIFALLGAWPILPFAGLELLALGTALYHASWKTQYRHVITINEDSICIDKGHYTPQQRWRLARHSTELTITLPPHSWDSPRLCVHDRDEHVCVGEFLNREDSLKLVNLLRQELHVRGYSAVAGRAF